MLGFLSSTLEGSAMAKDLLRMLQTLFPPGAEEGRQLAWRPAADVYRTLDGWLVKFDLAGVRPEEIHLEVSGHTLTVRGTRRDCLYEEGCRHYLMEIAYSEFERSIKLPDDLGQARLTTQYRDGLLLVHLGMEVK
jgi:HSP20 family protein